MKTMKRLAAFLAILLLAASCIPPTPQQNNAHILVNEIRAQHGLPLVHDSLLARGKAQGWAETMAKAGRIWHNPDLASGMGDDWTILGEVVGRASSIRSVNEAFLNSPSHRAILLGRGYRYFGAGIVRVSPDVAYYVYVFSD